MKKTHVFVVVLLLFVSGFNALLRSQTTITVCNSGCNYTTIQAAMNAAASGDIILLNVNGTFTEKDITIPEKNLTVRGLGKTTTILQSATTRASASGGRIFVANPPTGSGGNSFTVEDMTIQYAMAPLINDGFGNIQSAGGVFYARGALKGLSIAFSRVKLYANETTAGNVNNSGGACFYISATGTITPYNASLIINDCTFDDNKVANSSGTSLSDGPVFNLLGSPNRLSVNNSVFSNNNGYTRGGVAYVGANWIIDISNSTFENNTARNGDGGCLHGRSGDWKIENCVFKNNTAVFVSSVNGNNGYGGAYMGGGAKFKNCTFYNNSAVVGGAISRSYNGAAVNNNDEMHIINCTFYGNSASEKGKTICYGTPGSTTSNNYYLKMVNTIITNGSGAAAEELHFSNYVYSYFSVNSKNYCNSIGTEAATPGTTPVFDFNSGNIATLGLSSTPALNGGTTENLALSSSSGLINVGTSTNGSNYTIPTTDQRGITRVSGVDVGAYEYVASVCNNPAIPTLSASSATICSGASSNLSVSAGALNSATAWKWYTGSCGGTLVGTGSSISVSPSSTTTYYVRGEGGCVTPGSCANITVVVSNPSATISFTATSCNGGSNGRGAVSATGGIGSYTYLWQPSGGTAALSSPLSAGSYTCTIMDAVNCSFKATGTVTQPSALSATTTQTNVSCNGGTNGRAVASVSGGTSPYIYSWFPSGGTGSTASGLGAGNYTCTITDNNSCSITRTVAITQPLALSATVSQTNIACSGNSTGKASVTTSGGTPGYTYFWTPSGGTASTASGLSAGNYTCTITDANSCNITKTVSITEPAAIVTTTAQTNINCNGGSGGSASVSVVSGGTPGYSYSWTPVGGTGAGASGLSAGNYTCTITDAANCTTIKTFVITQPATLTATPSQTNISCNGSANGRASVSATGGTPAYGYSWAPSGGTGSVATSLGAGSYTCTITDTKLCTALILFNITEPAVLSAITTQTNINCNGASTGKASVAVSGGTTPYSYSWTPVGGTGATASALTAGTYTCRITDANSCAMTRTVNITQPTALSVVSTQTDVSCNAGANGIASVAVSGGATPYTYVWAPTGGTAATASGLVAGTYTCTITDGNNCTSLKTVTLNQPTALSVVSTQTNVSCNSGTNGSTSVTVSGGTTPYTYLWAPGGSTGSTLSGLASGTYTCTITDGNSCIATKTVAITQPTVLSAITSQTNISCFGNNTGAASLVASGGTTAYTYLWLPGGSTTSSISGLIAGTYSCTITDANSCTLTKTVTITQPSSGLTTTSAGQSNVSCNGLSNGTASVTIPTTGTAPYTYSWTPGNPSGNGTPSVTGLAAGSFTCTIGDANTCTTKLFFTITEPATLTATTTQTNVSCNAGNNGAAQVSPAGGTTPYTYVWSNGASTAVNSGLVMGIYSATVTDAHACSTVKTVTVTEPAVLTATTTQNNVSCNGGSNGMAQVSPAGGTTPYTYAWSNGASTATNSGLGMGIYTATITDAHVCSTIKTFTITEPAVLTGTTTQNNVSCNGGSNGTAQVSVSGGTTPYTYLWSNGASTATNSGLAMGVYTATITDAHICTIVKTVTITEPVILTATTTQTNVSCNAGTNGSAELSPAGGTAPYTYVWSNGATTAVNSGLVMGIYTATITDAHSCTIVKTVTITEPVVLTATTTQTNVSCNAGTNGVAQVSPAGGTTPYAYAWSNGASTAVNAGLTMGVYTATVTDAHACSTIKSFTITQPAVLTATTTQNNVSCNGGSNGMAQVSTSGGTTPYTYVWSNGSSTATNSGLIMGIYTATITDAHACSAIKTFTVTEPLVLTASATQTNVSCNAGTNGVAELSPAGGTAPYTYVWSNGATTAVNSGLVMGIYTATITDAHICTIVKTVTITEPVVLTATTTQTNVSCNAGNNGAAQVNPAGGTTPYAYAWSNAATTAINSGLTMGVYTATVTDANLCVTVKSFTVTEPTLVVVNATATQTLVCAGTASTLNATSSGGTGAITYVWNTGSTSATETVIPFATTVYTVQATDANSCTKTATVLVTANPAPVITVNSGAICSGKSFTMVPSGAVTYTYSGGSEVVSPLATTSYSVSGTGANGCVSLVSAVSTVTVNALPVVTIVTTNASVCDGSSVTLTANGASTYVWNNGQTTGSISEVLSSSTNYTVTGSNGLGCSSSASTTIIVFANPTVTIGGDIEIKIEDTYQFNPTQTGAVSYAWSPSTDLSNTSVINPVTSTQNDITYSLTVTSIHGCVAGDVVNVKVLNELIIANYVSPNGDGDNDTWKVSIPALIKNYSVAILNSWGKTVFSKSSGYNNEWDAADLPDGVYYYVIKEGSKVKFKGDITVTR